MKKRTLTPSNIIFTIFIVLLIIPQTRTAMQVALNMVRVQLLSPSALEKAAQIQLEPFEYQMIDLKGNAVTTEIGHGKVVFLSYWATWCPPCIAELPSIQKFYNDYGDEIEFVLLTDEAPETVHEFLKRKQYNIPVFMPRIPMPKALYERSIPTNYIIDKKGKVVVKEQGATDWNSEKVRGIVGTLLQE